MKNIMNILSCCTCVLLRSVTSVNAEDKKVFTEKENLAEQFLIVVESNENYLKKYSKGEIQDILNTDFKEFVVNIMECDWKDREKIKKVQLDGYAVLSRFCYKIYNALKDDLIKLKTDRERLDIIVVNVVYMLYQFITDLPETTSGLIDKSDQLVSICCIRILNDFFNDYNKKIKDYAKKEFYKKGGIKTRITPAMKKMLVLIKDSSDESIENFRKEMSAIDFVTSEYINTFKEENNQSCIQGALLYCFFDEIKKLILQEGFTSDEAEDIEAIFYSRKCAVFNTNDPNVNFDLYLLLG